MFHVPFLALKEDDQFLVKKIITIKTALSSRMLWFCLAKKGKILRTFCLEQLSALSLPLYIIEGI
jgi:hypothetical protein